MAMMDFANVNAAELDRLSGTFSRDQEFCGSLAVANGPEVARILIYVRWARNYIPPIQLEMESLIHRHFDSVNGTQAGFWTIALLGATMRDLGIIGYLVVRGLIWDAGYGARRGLENVGVLAALWTEPAKAALLGSPEEEAFRKAFVWESDNKARVRLRDRGIQKRFEFCSMAAGISQLYALLSKYSVHGGSTAVLAAAEREPTPHSCMFINRPDPSSKDISRDVTIIGNACEMLAN
jgi:hypothetical protein